MKVLRYTLSLVTLFQLAAWTKGECVLPGPWTEGQWFSHYDNSLTWLVRYGRQVYMYSVAHLTRTVTAGFACQHSERLDGGDYMLLLNNDRLYCLKVAPGPEDTALLVKMAPIPNPAVYARDCVGKLDTADIAWQIRYPFSSSSRPCPFGGTQGGDTLYQAVVTIMDEAQCFGDQRSNVMVTGDGQVVLNTCVKTNNYAFPLSGATLRCVSEVAGEEVDGGEDVVLLAYDHGPTTRFYCGRHSKDSGLIYLSLGTEDKDRARCMRGASSRTASDASIALTLTAVPDDTCSCVFGSCTEVGGLRKCQCQTGYTGLHCETALPEGSCQSSNAPCENDAVCEDVAPYFYYCDCPYGYIGTNCQSPTSCQPNPCLHGGVCKPFGPDFRCTCPPPYAGDRCQQNAESADLQEPTSATGGNNTLIIVLVTLTGGVVIAGIGIAIMVCQRRLRRKEKGLPVNPDGELPKQSSSMQAWRPEYMDTYNSRLAQEEQKAVDSD